MDSPVIVDAASKFGEGIDLDRSFPGFSFDDDADIFDRPRRDGIRSHLDDLAARHPELAEHLRGPPWSFGSSLLRDRRHRRRNSGGSNSDNQQQQGQQHQVDEDARSQASGSSAASGASAVSSRSSDEPDLTSSAIPQYGLRNTVDIGQQQRRRGMEMSPEMGDRGQRSMSAPPENRQQGQSEQQQQQSQPGQGQRFVSRVDITPQHNQQQQRSQSPSKPSSNVRHIPIFVEGRDEPVMPRFAADKAPSPPPAFHQRQPSPPSFHRPSHFNDHFSRQWPPGFYESTFDPGFESSFRPMRRHQQFQQHQQPQYHQESQYQKQPQYQKQSQHQQPQHRQPQQQPQYRQQQQKQHTQQEQQQQPQQQQETQKPKQTVPKDPLEKVAEVQKEVDDLAEQVRRYAGGSRQDKEYIYLDEMLTRELIKLDDIETEGRENVRQARKNAIKTIQETISLLETKAPLSVQLEQQPMEEESEQKEEQCADKTKESQASEPMNLDAKQEKNEPIPPDSSTEIKEKTESLKNETMTTESESQNQGADSAAQQQTGMEIEQEVEKTETKEPVAPTSTDEAAKRADETNRESKPDGEQQKDDNAMETTTESKDVTLNQKPEEAKDSKMEVDNVQQSSTESPKSQKKTKKTKKKQQQPVSEQAIPLPPPSAESAK